ncbi:RNA polymerase sigma-70 factor [Mucilaginibacter conchicola]|uniref:RNA polymerase sigma-70 factor n=1 Tax=Mucilaginibacter conchicola TaxID=2303333 RepID=A0A372NZF0_9SPHI|nr:RNA polymerase sigma-70 factor [Mucilaginibacter conchicola]RFZ95483.1 RNA polymerase sigma-70 factor [Mucilaginibacter conchicola]
MSYSAAIVISDEQLLQQWRNGDTTAYDSLFKRYYIPLLHYAQKNLKDDMVAEELVMDVMLRVWKKDGDINAPAGFRPYLLRSVKNAIFNHYRIKIPELLSLDDMPLSASPLSKAPDELMHEEEISSVYEKVVSQLPEKRQRVFRMSREENLTYSEIASKLGLSINTVENYMSASLASCRKTLEEINLSHLLIFIIPFLQ